MEKRKSNGIDYEASSGNMYADLGFPNAEEHKIKAGLAMEITLAIRRLDLTQHQAAERMGLSQPKVSEMMRGKLEQFFERKLMDCLKRLGYDIEIKIKPFADPVGQFQLAFA